MLAPDSDILKEREGEAFEVGGGGGRSFFPPYCGSSTHRWKPARRPAFKGLPLLEEDQGFVWRLSFLNQPHRRSVMKHPLHRCICTYFYVLPLVLCMRVKVWSKKNRITFSKLKKKDYEKIIIEIIFERTASGAVLTCVHAWRSCCCFYFQTRVLSK